ncbi:hypothetical protein DIURU_004125 [Diutina rugosa]|uniref:DUF4112 domain-containing protein n=1 Tax=Diutina rugosa TaxID=5481 RepID=A0A642UKW7_DIURU|nr:uncharacterized protein DIURU_004125 [Diutina rugosa]KAA8899868.1 hypothetical protein DIURU_004125 [Diutina rugosa]
MNVGPKEDPYYEEIPENERHFYQRKGATRKRKLPDFIPKHDYKVLQSVRRRAYHLDLALSLCGFRLGWAGIIGLIPGIGDVLALFFALQLINKAKQVEGGLPDHIAAKMSANVMFDFGIGLIPFVGDLINIAYKCNSRNFIILEQYLVQKYSTDAPVGAVIGKQSANIKGHDHKPQPTNAQDSVASYRDSESTKYPGAPPPTSSGKHPVPPR